jgi:hypothetical protein
MCKEVKKAIAYTVISFTILYFLIVAGYFLTASEILFRCWEIMIILAAPIILILLISILENVDKDKNCFKTAAIAFMICTATITATAHYANVISRNEIIFEFQLNDSLAWGFFMGLAFIFTSIALTSEIPKLKKIKYTTLICGCLCLLGLIGPISDITVLWFVAVAGYGIGTPIICIQLILFYKNQK